MKKVLTLLLSLFVLAGCSQNLAPVATALKQSLDDRSVESSATVRLSTNADLAKVDPMLGKAAKALEAGLVINEQMRSEKEAHLSVTLANPEAVKGTDLWPFQQDPGLDLYLNNDEVYLKTTADDKFLGLKEPSDAQTVDPSAVKPHLIAFMDKFDFPFQHAELVGQETIQVHGQSVDATHVRVAMDFPEAVGFAAYTLESIANYDRLKELLQLTAGPMPVADDELAQLKSELTKAAAEMKQTDVNALKAQGWDVGITMDFWVSPDQRIVQDKLAATVKVPGSLVPELKVPTADLKLDVEEQSWNHNLPVSYTLPAASDIVNADELKTTPELMEAFPEGSLLRLIAESLVPPQDPFVDVTVKHWAHDEILALHEMGVVNGYADHTFKPDRQITRAEFVKMAVEALGIEPQTGAVSFKDKGAVPAWANAYVQTAVKAGLVKGYADGTFRPNQKITRAEMVTILVRGMEVPLEQGFPLAYNDAKAIPGWAVPYVKTAAAYDLVKGRPGNRFAPQELTTRAEVCAVLYRIIVGEQVQE